MGITQIIIATVTSRAVIACMASSTPIDPRLPSAHIVTLLRVNIDDIKDHEDVFERELIDRSAIDRSVVDGSAIDSRNFHHSSHLPLQIGGRKNYDFPKFFSDKDKWPKSTAILCRSCSLDIEGEPRFVPKGARDNCSILDVEGLTCSFACASRYINDRYGKERKPMETQNRESLLNLLYVEYYMMTGKLIHHIEPAPHKTSMCLYGGPLSVEEFKAQVKLADNAVLGSASRFRHSYKNVTDIRDVNTLDKEVEQYKKMRERMEHEEVVNASDASKNQISEFEDIDFDCFDPEVDDLMGVTRDA